MVALRRNPCRSKSPGLLCAMDSASPETLPELPVVVDRALCLLRELPGTAVAWGFVCKYNTRTRGV